MKKVILSAAALLAFTCANAQDNGNLIPNTGQSEDLDIQVAVSMTLPDWIDLDFDNQNLITASGLPSSWDNLNNGFAIGEGQMRLSASRKCQINAMADNVVRSGGTDGNAGDYFPAQKLSLQADDHNVPFLSAVYPEADAYGSLDWGVSYPVANTLVNKTAGDAADFEGAGQTFVETSTGVYLHRIAYQVSAFITGNVPGPGTLGAGNYTPGAGASAAGDYYGYNLVGGTYETTLYFGATLQ